MKVSNNFISTADERKREKNLDPVNDRSETEAMYYFEMEKFDLLTAEEEYRYSRTIRINFQAMVDKVIQSNSSSRELSTIKDMLKKWKKDDSALKPQQIHRKEA